MTGEQTRGALSLVEACGQAGTEPPLHYHEAADEFFYVLDGEMTFKVGELVKRIGPGGFVWIPRMATHGFVIHGTAARFLFGFVPAGLERMFDDIGGSSENSATAEIRDAAPAAKSATDTLRELHRTIVVGPRLRDCLA